MTDLVNCCCGAVFVVVLLTDGTVVDGLKWTGNERSRMARYGRDLCSTIAIGDIFSWGGGAWRISFQCTMRACPFATFSFTSISNWAIASGTNAEICGPRSIALCICSSVHVAPVFVGQPFSVYFVSVDAAG